MHLAQSQVRRDPRFIVRLTVGQLLHPLPRNGQGAGDNDQHSKAKQQLAFRSQRYGQLAFGH